MSDQTEPVGDEHDDDTIDLGAMTEDELRTYHAQLTERIDELKAQPRTIARAEEINSLREERNMAVEAVRTLLSAEGAEIEDAALDEPAASDTTDADTGDGDAPEGDAPEGDTPTGDDPTTTEGGSEPTEGTTPTQEA